tara:strand:+ start:138 stop:788 length:651 start_codon:yes stop_codon:yes gene_type:complete
MKINRIDTPFPVISIDNFIPSEALVRAASESFNDVDDWVKYSGDDNQVQLCSKLGRENIPPSALLVLDYITTNFDPNKVFGLTDNAFPDTSHYGGGMMITPNSNNEGGYLGMHVDATTHGLHNNWKREYSAILCLSEEYDSSFDLRIHNGKEHGTIPYKFNTLNVFKCSNNSWHGLPEITKGMNRKTLGVMYWSIMTEEDKKTAIKARFNNDLEFK